MDKTIFKQIYDLLDQDIKEQEVDKTNYEEVKLLQIKHQIKNTCYTYAKELIENDHVE